MKMIKYIMALFMMIGITAGYAQQPGTNPAVQAKQLQAQLQLTDAQTTKLTAVYTQLIKEAAKDKAAQANLKQWKADNNRKAMADYILKQMDMSSARIKPILTPAQQKIYEANDKKSRDLIKSMVNK